MQQALILLQGEAAPGGSYMTFIMMGGLVLAMYFLMIRPQQRKQKEQKKYVDSLGKGDAVVTVGGMHGKVAEIDNDTVLIEVDKGYKLRFEKSSISGEASQRVNGKK